MVRTLEPSLLPQRSLVSKPRFFQYAIRCRIAGQRPGLDPVEPERLMAAADHGMHGLGHQALPPKIRMRLIPKLAPLPFLVDAIEADDTYNGL